MTPYPSLRQSVSSTESRLASRLVDRATNGAVKSRSLVPSPKKSFKVVHEFITQTQKQELESHYTANCNISFDFIWVPDNLTYQCIYDAEEPYFEIVRGGYWNASVSLLQI